MSYKFDGHPVSKPWHSVLVHARRMGVEFTVTDGRRTLAMQRQRVRDHGVWSASNPTGAARPSLAAPHINFYRANHAIDVGRGAVNLVSFLQKEGAHTVVRPIPAEPWHIEIGHDTLVRLGNRYTKARQS